MKSKIYILAALLFFGNASLVATAVRIFNKVDPKKDIYFKLDKKINVPLKYPDKDGFYAITDSQYVDAGTSGIKTLFWRYEPAGQIFSKDINWDSAFDTGQAYIFNDTIVIVRNLDVVRGLTHTFILDFIKRGKEIAETTKDFLTQSGQFFAAPLNELIKKELASAIDNPYKNSVAAIRQGGPVGSDEQTFLQARLPIVKAAQEKFLGTTFAAGEQPLRVDLIFSGGGIRSMYLTLGQLVALLSLGIIDMADYIATLSGSTWAVFPWLLGDPSTNGQPLPLKKYLDNVLSRFEDGLFLATKPAEHAKEVSYILNALLVKFAYGEPIDPGIEIYGALLGNKLFSQFGNKRQQVHISDIGSIIKTGKFPMPIGTVKFDAINDWVYVTPWEVGGPQVNYIPTWAFGRQFRDGKSVGTPPYQPEQSASFYLGMFGSAPAVSLRETYDNVIKNMNVSDFTKQAFQKAIETEIGSLRGFWAELFNPYLVGGKIVGFVDAGVDRGTPAAIREIALANVAQARPIVKIIFDNSSVVGAEELYKQAKHFEERGFVCPLKTADFKQVGTRWEFKDAALQKAIIERALTVYYHPSGKVVWIYITRIVDKKIDYAAWDPTGAYRIDQMKMTTTETESEYSTFNLKYTSEQAKRLAKLGEINLLAYAKEIKDVLLKTVELQRPQKTTGAEKTQTKAVKA